MNEDLTFEELEMALEIELESFELIDKKVSQMFEERKKAQYLKNIKMKPRLSCLNKKTQNQVSVSKSTVA